MEKGRESASRTVSLGVFVGSILILIVILGYVGFMYTTTSANYEKLQKDYAAKSQLYDSLNESYAHLVSQYTQLNGSYVALQNDYADLLQITKLQKNQTIFTNYVLNLPKNGFEGIQFSSQYAGYIEVRISATAPVSLIVTNYKYGVVLDYPVNGETFTSASFKMPVLDGITYMQFFSTPTSSSVVTVNTTLYY